MTWVRKKEKTFHHDKSRGQNFLVDQTVLQKIVEAGELKSSDVIVEAGAGTGVLTKELASQTNKVITFEIDQRLVLMLKNNLANFSNVELHNEDILKNDFLALPLKYKLIANIPYNITSSILQKFLSLPIRPELIVLLVQREVAERICAKPGEMSLLSVITQYYGDPEIVSLVPAAAFKPMPKVESAILKIVMHTDTFLDIQKEKELFRIVKAGFAQKRKMLKNNLKAITLPNIDLSAVFSSLVLDQGIRAEDMSITDWLKLREKLEKAQAK